MIEVDVNALKSWHSIAYIILLKCFMQLLAYMNAQNTFFHQGSDMFEDIDSFMKEVATQVRPLCPFNFLSLCSVTWVYYVPTFNTNRRQY